jgi:uncharacterized protein (DUF2235 family)
MPTQKRIVLCSDGTWNRPDELDNGSPAPTNVYKLACAISREDSRGMPQVVYYHTGVGAEGNIIDHVVGGAFGDGIDRIIEDGYRFLAQNYAVGDEIWLFGFSRGAYMARSTAGLIRNVGILHPEALGRLHEAVSLYRRADSASAPEGAEARRFREQYAREAPVHFIGVWDTVGALGIPTHILPLLDPVVEKIDCRVSRYEFHDNVLSSRVLNAFQALAVDEHRKPFEPSVWQGQGTAVPTQRLEQVWFPGVHSNVGGGYADHGLSDLALQWMIEKASSCGLAVKPPQDMKPNAAGQMRDSMTLLYEMFGPVEREIKLGTSGQALHSSVGARIGDAALDYHPHNVPGRGARSTG